jgi:hypothetical protein
MPIKLEKIAMGIHIGLHCDKPGCDHVLRLKVKLGEIAHSDSVNRQMLDAGWGPLICGGTRMDATIAFCPDHLRQYLPDT